MTVIRNTGPMGPEILPAPEGWEYDKTATEAWYWLLVYTRKKDFKLQRDRVANEAKIDVLAQILSNSLGMAGYFWAKSAREIVDAE